jgi:hypothetical protein
MSGEKMDYAEYRTPSSVAHCLKVLGKCRELRKQRYEERKKLINRHGKAR